MAERIWCKGCGQKIAYFEAVWLRVHYSQEWSEWPFHSDCAEEMKKVKDSTEFSKKIAELTKLKESE